MVPVFYRAIVTEVQVKARSVEGREKEMETRDRGADGTRIDNVTDPFIPPDLRARDVKRQKERIGWVGCVGSGLPERLRKILEVSKSFP